MGIFDEKLVEFHRIFKIANNYKIPQDLLTEALTHPSYRVLNPDTNDYERLETVGDAVLDLIVVSWLYKSGAEDPRQLTNARSSTVENKALTKFGKELQLHTFIKIAPNYEIQSKDFADTMEAIIGAYFMAHGFEECYKWVVVLLKDTLQEVLNEVREQPTKWGHAELNPVNILQEFFQKRHLRIPTPELVRIEGKNHEKMYTIKYSTIFQGIRYISEAKARKKKLANKLAAKDLCYKLGLLDE